MPGPICCLLGACCPPRQQIAALSSAMIAGGASPELARYCAAIVAPMLRAMCRAAGMTMTNQEEEAEG